MSGNKKKSRLGATNFDNIIFNDKKEEKKEIDTKKTEDTETKEGDNDVKGTTSKIVKKSPKTKSANKPTKKYVNKEVELDKSGTESIEDYLIKNEHNLQIIQVHRTSKKKIEKAASILGVNQYDLTTNIINKFFEKYGDIIKAMEEDVL